jgi:hypothetical protein
MGGEASRSTSLGKPQAKLAGSKSASELRGYDLTISVVANIIMSTDSLTTTVAGRMYSQPAPAGAQQRP